jgi:hypothetical protein
VIIRQNLKHHLGTAYSEEHIQATSIVLEDQMGEVTVTAVYSPPKHNIKTIEYEQFFRTLGHRFIAGGDYNAKNTCWGARTTTKGRELHNAMRKHNLRLSSCQPTYWPSDMNKQPDLLDFCYERHCYAESFSRLVSGTHIGPYTNYSNYTYTRPTTTEKNHLFTIKIQTGKYSEHY